MRHFYSKLAIFCLVAFGAISCTTNNKEPQLPLVESSLFGEWEAPSASKPSTHFQYCIFLKDKAESGEYLGKMWDEGDDVTEEDLQYLGNGWFKWKMNASELIEIHLLDNGGAEVPKYYTITNLTETKLTYKDSQKAFSWKRVVRK